MLAAVRILLIRFFHAALSIIGLTIIIFLMVRITGDPVSLILPDEATRETHELVRSNLGLDRPLPIQYALFLKSLAEGDLGTSFSFHIPVWELVQQRFPATVLLAIVALLASLLVGVPLGLYSAYWRGGWIDRVARFGAVLGQAAPPFWVGIILIIVFGVHLQVLPAGGYGGLSYLILPAIALALPAIAGLTRLVRSSMIEVLETDYVKFLRIKGVPEREIIWKHGLRNAGLTALTFMGVIAASMLTGSVVVESVFAWPGVGQLMAQAIAARDFPVIQGVVLIFSILYVGMNLIVDLLYAVLNPRLRTRLGNQ